MAANKDSKEKKLIEGIGIGGVVGGVVGSCIPVIGPIIGSVLGSGLSLTPQLIEKIKKEKGK